MKKQVLFIIVLTIMGLTTSLYSQDLNLVAGSDSNVNIKGGFGNSGTGGNVNITAGDSHYEGGNVNISSNITEAYEEDGDIILNSGHGLIKLQTSWGYLDIGPRNSAWCHYNTNRPKHYFNKPVTVNNTLSSYNSNLILEGASGKFVDLRSKSSTYGVIIREYNSSDFGNLEVTSAGLGIGYNTSGSHLTIGANGRMYMAGQSMPRWNNSFSSYVMESKYYYGHSNSGDIYLGESNNDIYVRGKIGIGTNGPNSKLDIRGDLRVGNGTKYIKMLYDGAHNIIECVGSSTLVNYYNREKIQFCGEVGMSKSLLVNNSIGIGTSTVPTGYKLAVDGRIIAEELVIDLSENWPDYVFKDTYKLRPLSEVEKFVQSNHHLPEIPSETEIEENGVSVGMMNNLLLKKIEEITLYLIEQEKEIESLKSECHELRNKLNQ